MKTKYYILFLLYMGFSKTNAVGVMEGRLAELGRGIDSVVGSETVQNLPQNIYSVLQNIYSGVQNVGQNIYSGVQNVVPYVGPYLQNAADTYTGVLVANQLGAQNYIPGTLAEYVPTEVGLGVDRDFTDAARQAFLLQLLAHPKRTIQWMGKGAQQGFELSGKAVNYVVGRAKELFLNQNPDDERRGRFYENLRIGPLPQDQIHQNPQD